MDGLKDMTQGVGITPPTSLEFRSPQAIPNGCRTQQLAPPSLAYPKKAEVKKYLNVVVLV